MIQSHPLGGTEFRTIEIVVGEDELPDAEDLEGVVVRARVKVPPDYRDQWEADLAAELDDLLRVATHAYPVEVEYWRAAEESERRVIEAPEPEGQFREYVEGLGLGEADAEAVLELGLDVMAEAGIE